MKYKFSSDMGWQNGLANQHSIELDLDLSLTDFLKSKKNIAAELATSEVTLRKEIFQLAVGQIVPKILEGTDLDWRLPSGKLNSKFHSDSHGEWQIGDPTEQTSVVIRDQMRIVLDVETDQPVNAMQALYASRDGLAGAITNTIIDALKCKYLGTTESDTHTSSQLSGDQVVDLEMRSKTDFQGN